MVIKQKLVLVYVKILKQQVIYALYLIISLFLFCFYT